IQNLPLPGKPQQIEFARLNITYTVMSKRRLLQLVSDGHVSGLGGPPSSPRLNITYTVMSKRRLLQLVSDGHVSGWDDPRMPTLSGMRRRGYTPAAIRAFCEEVGVAKRENVIDVGLLEFFVREDLNRHAPRAMAVLRPLKVVIEDYPDGQVE